MNVAKYSGSLKLNDEGIYTSSNSSIISYPSHGNNKCYEIEDNSFWFEHRNNVILRLINNYLNEPIILDVGGGNGYVSIFLQKNDIIPILLEPGIDGIVNAKGRGLKNLIHSTLEDASIKPHSIPNIGLFDVIEHIEDDQLFLSNLNNILKPKGKIFITVPAFKFLWSENDVRAGHFRRYTKKSMEKLLQHENFTIEYISYFFSALPIPIFIKRTIPALLKIKSKDHNKKSINEHKKTHGYISKFLNRMIVKELKSIGESNYLPYGSSLCVVASKKN